MFSIALKAFVVEYSVNENATLIRTLENVIRNNLHNVRNAQSKDYLPVGLFSSREEADRFREQLILITSTEAQSEFRGINWRSIADCLDEAFDQALTRPDSDASES
ncbi:MAG: hypothetical protein QOD75_1941 [Blastocatellia bacterium]|jgi:hypothetical protein|nr:hypothetical protein [Blastocatellia bacterium]